MEELRSIISEKDQIEREFKCQALIAPDFKDKAFGRVPAYDFSTNSIFTKDPFKEPEWLEKQLINEKPKDLMLITSEPKVLFNYEEYKVELLKEKPITNL